MATTRRPLAPLVAVLIALVQTVGTALGGGLPLFGYVLLATSGLALVARRRHPSATVVVVIALTLTYQLLDYPGGPTFLAAIIAVLTALMARRHRAVWLSAIIAYFVWLAVAEPSLGRAMVVAAWFVGLGMLTGILIGAARFLGPMIRDQQRLHEEKRRRQASEERLRIAQELHDVLGHHLSLINVRASVGRHLMDRQPEQAKVALDTIKDASAEALREVRSVLDALYPEGQSAPRAPSPGLDRLDELTHDAGLPVYTTITGIPRPLPAEIDRAAYRIVQEALTNVRRHSGAGVTATVTIEYQQEESVMVQIEDDGGAVHAFTAPAMDGNGISGMRERATALGGSLTAQPLPGGGWQVRALLPLPFEAGDAA